MLTLLALLAGPAAWGAEPGTAVVILPESASVQSSELLLGEIAEISGPPDLVEKLAQVSAGTAPQPGSSRRLTKGQIEVRLRQAGVDPKLVEFQGAAVVQVYGTASSAAGSPAGQQAVGVPVYEVVVASRDLKRRSAHSGRYPPGGAGDQGCLDRSPLSGGFCGPAHHQAGGRGAPLPSSMWKQFP